MQLKKLVPWKGAMQRQPVSNEAEFYVLHDYEHKITSHNTDDEEVTTNV